MPQFKAPMFQKKGSPNYLAILLVLPESLDFIRVHQYSSTAVHRTQLTEYTCHNKLDLCSSIAHSTLPAQLHNRHFCLGLVWSDLV